jgi:arylsulfatase A-like enzyme
MDSSLRVLDVQDPDIMFILMAGTDDAGHMVGAAWDPSAWDDRGTPSTWDDVNRINPACVREEMLDAVRESDTLFGNLTASLQQRGILEDVYIVLVSDHGMVSSSPHRLDVGKLLEAHGYSNKDDFNANAGGPIGLFFGVADEEKANFEWVLENGPSIAPGLDRNPWVVINRAEMRTGIDAQTGIQFGEPDELYSEFFVEHNTGATDMAKWPDFLMLFQDYSQIVPLHFESTMGEEESLAGEAFNGAHGFLLTQPSVLVMSGPGVPQGHVNSAPVHVNDIAPTLYDLLGWPVPPHVRGSTLPDVIVK